MSDLKQAAVTFWASVVAKAWQCDDFKSALIKNPKGELAKMGYGSFKDSNDEDVNIKVMEATSADSCQFDAKTNTLTLFLPKKPDCLQNLEFEGTFGAGICC